MTTPTADPSSEKNARWLVRTAAIAQSLFFVFVTYYLMRINPKGGFELNAVVPLALIFLLLVLPSLLLSLFKRFLLFPALLCLFALAANYLVFSQIVSSFAR